MHWTDYSVIFGVPFKFIIFFYTLQFIPSSPLTLKSPKERGKRNPQPLPTYNSNVIRLKTKQKLNTSNVIFCKFQFAF